MEEPKIKKGVIAFAVFAAFVLYFSGVFSGLYAKDATLKQTESDINQLKLETRQDLSEFSLETEQDIVSLSSYISFLDRNLKSMQLEETFAETLNEKEKCEYSRISLDELVNQLGYYWEKLPFRLEEYEKNNQPTSEYLQLKAEYTDLSIRIWILARRQNENCNTDIVPGLHFYSKDCEECVAQGEQIDKLNSLIAVSGRNLIMFPVDSDSTDPLIANLRRFYSINSTPAVIINDRVFQGKLFEAEELFAEISGK